MTYKYQDEYDKLSEMCPPKHFTKQDISPVYRWLFDEDDSRNFLPQYHRNPRRFNNVDDQLKCTSMGLSFFKDLKGAEERHNELSKVIPNIAKAIGTHTSKGFILESDGVSGDFGHHSHFTHHACETDVFKERFKIVK